MLKHMLFLLILGNLLCSIAGAQDIYVGKQYQFLSFETIPTWTGVAADWDKDRPLIHLYDPVKYKGHAQYISQALKTGMTFKQFKEQVSNYQTRKYLPFFLFDLRDSPITEDSVTNPDNSRTPESIFFKTFSSAGYEVKSKSSIRDIFLQEDLKAKLNELKNLSIQIHNKLSEKTQETEKIKYGVDIEFRLMKENNEFRLYIKQARLLGTTLPE
jgi:hypothetical protein